MAKKRYNFARKARKSVGGFFRRAKSRGKSQSGGLMMALAASVLYGAFRKDLAQYAAPLTSKLPFGGMSDEVVLGGLAYLGSRYGSGVVRTASLSALHVEAALAGSALREGSAFNSSQAPGSRSFQPSVNV